jgi:DNA modification methylase
MNQFNGSHPRMAMGIEVMWKPMLWYVKDAYPQGRGFLRDGIEITGKNGQTKSSGHKWEQDITWAEYYIKKLTNEGDIVLDPYMGSGTVAEVCIKLKRRYIGFEINKEYWDLSNERIDLVLSQNI